MRISRSTMSGLHPDTDVRLSELIPPRDYNKLNWQDCQLRVWLPDPAKQALEEICEIYEISMTAYLTEYFASYLYGCHELLRMRINKLGLYEPKPERRYNAMSTGAPPPEPNLGKNIFALKIWVPEKIKGGLRLLADRTGVTLGEFSRALICAHLFGRDYGANKLMGDTMMSRDIACKWENNATHDDEGS